MASGSGSFVKETLAGIWPHRFLYLGLSGPQTMIVGNAISKFYQMPEEGHAWLSLYRVGL